MGVGEGQRSWESALLGRHSRWHMPRAVLSAQPRCKAPAAASLQPRNPLAPNLLPPPSPRPPLTMACRRVSAKRGASGRRPTSENMEAEMPDP